MSQSLNGKIARRGLPITLVDAHTFYSALELAQINHYQEYDEHILARVDQGLDVLKHESIRG